MDIDNDRYMHQLPEVLGDVPAISLSGIYTLQEETTQIDGKESTAM